MTHDQPHRPEDHSEGPASGVLHRYLCGVAEQTFHAELGVADPPLVDYVSDLLVRFVRMEALQKVRDPSGNRLKHLSSMLAEAESRMGDAKRAVHRHIGDYALFWAGLFPEAVRRNSAGDGFQTYCEHGKRAYHVASRIESDTMPPAEVLEQLADEFEMCAYGLHEVRRELHRRDGDDEPPKTLLFG